jgi:hypothetical protein
MPLALTNGNGALSSSEGVAALQDLATAHANKAKEQAKETALMRKTCGQNQVKARKVIDLFSAMLAQTALANAPREVLAALKALLDEVTKYHDDCSIGAVNPETSQYTVASTKQEPFFGLYLHPVRLQTRAVA